MRRGGVALWRIGTRTEAHAADDLAGEGARLWGGRWNRTGESVTYTACSISLAVLETLAHQGESGPAIDAFLVRIDVPADVWKKRRVVRLEDLPANWADALPQESTLDLGGQWLAGADSALLAVPSVIVPEETNVLINPRHPAAARLAAHIARPFVFDLRLGSAW